MEARLQEIREETAARPKVYPDMLYNYFDAVHPLAEGRVNLRVPQIFTRQNLVFHELSIPTRRDNPDSKQPYPPERIYPLGVALPGYAWTYEGNLSDAGEDAKANPQAKRWSFSFYIAAAHIPPAYAPAEVDSYLSELSTKLTEAGVALSEPLTFATLTSDEIKDSQGETIEWRKIHVEGDFFFDSFVGFNEDSWEKKPGVIELYIGYSRQHLIILGAKWLQGMENVTLLPYYLPLVASTVKIDEAGLPPAPEEAAEEKAKKE